MMPTYTKETIITYQDTVYSVPEDWLILVQQKGLDMLAEGKTDNNFAIVDANHVRRVWLDQNAADEWVAFLMPLNEQFGVVVSDIQVNDNPSGIL